MARYVLIGITGSKSLSLIDLEGGSLETIPPESVDESISKVREAGDTVVRGVDVAVAIDERQDAVGRFFFDGGAVR